jgi:hypothetical protein
MAQHESFEFENIAGLEAEIAAWEASRNDQRATVDWQFTMAHAREKIKRLYPVISCKPY